MDQDFLLEKELLHYFSATAPFYIITAKLRFLCREPTDLDAGNVFRCHGKTVTIKSGERVLLHTPRTAVVLDDIIQVKG